MFRLLLFSSLLTPRHRSDDPPSELGGSPEVIQVHEPDDEPNDEMRTSQRLRTSVEIAIDADDSEVDNIPVDPDEDDEQDDVDDTPPSRTGRGFRRRGLSISRTFSTFSTIIDGRYRNYLDWPFGWFRKLTNLFRPSVTLNNDRAPNYRYTPILSGIVIPFAILLAIPGLTEHWYIRTDQNKTVETQKNPLILNLGLGVSILCAVLANVCLVLRFMEKRVKTMTILCVVFLSAHGTSSTHFT
jgi:potassium channel subfamily K